MENLIVRENETIKCDDRLTYEFNNIIINSGGMLTCNGITKYKGVLLLYIKNDLIIKNGGCIDMSCIGHSGGKPRSTGIGFGAGISCIYNNGKYIVCMLNYYDLILRMNDIF